MKSFHHVFAKGERACKLFEASWKLEFPFHMRITPAKKHSIRITAWVLAVNPDQGS